MRAPPDPGRHAGRRGRPSAALATLVWSQSWWVLGTALLAFATLGSGVGLVAVSAYLISRAALVDSTADLGLAITGVRFFAVCRAAFRYVERYIGHLATFRVLTRLRVWFFRGIAPLAPARLSGRRSGDLLSRILGDIDVLQDLALRVVVPAVAAGLATALTALVLGSLSPWLGALAALELGVVGLAVPAATHRLASRPAAALAEADGALEAEAVESVRGLAELVAWGREDRFTEGIARATDRRAVLDRRLARVRGGAGAASSLLVGLGAMALLAMAVALVGDGELDGVYLALVPLVALAAFEAVTPMTAAVEQLSRVRTAAGRLEGLLDAEPPVAEPRTPAPGPARRAVGVDLAVDGLWFAHVPGGTPVLAGLSLRLPAGSVAHVRGASGAGKSTLVELLLRFRDYHRGSVRVDSTELRDLRPADARACFAAVQQHDHLFDTSVRDNLLLGDPDADDGRILRALGAADATGFVARLPEGLDTRVGENGGNLSGGERQRLMIARALLADAPVLLLDEATAHLDGPTEARVVAGVRRWQRGRTLVVASHGDLPGPAPDVVVDLDRQRPPSVASGPTL